MEMVIIDGQAEPFTQTCLSYGAELHAAGGGALLYTVHPYSACITHEDPTWTRLLAKGHLRSALIMSQ